MLIDTHCHINLMVKKEFDIPLSDDELEAAQLIIEAAAADGVARIINVGTSLTESKNSIKLSELYPNVFATVGIHPNDLEDNWRNDFEEIKKLIAGDVPSPAPLPKFSSMEGLNPSDPTLTRLNKQKKIVGVGETGIDLYRSADTKQRQIDAFKMHIDCALENNVGLVVHSRNAVEETLRVLEEYAKNNLRATIHCFSYDHDFANSFINLGFYLGIGATITYPKNDLLREIVSRIPLESIVLETDAPFLPPQQMRGKQNHPKYIRTVAEHIAELKGIPLDEVARVTTANAVKLFNMPL